MNVGVDDCGEIECRAVNVAGTVSIRANIGLKGQYTAMNIKLLNLVILNAVPAQLKPSPQLQEGFSFHRGQIMKLRVPFASQIFRGILVAGGILPGVGFPRIRS